MSTSGGSTHQQADETIERIRALNEQILKSGREWGQSFLDAYEQNLRTFADIQERTAEGSDMEWVAQIAKAQADFTREVAKYSTQAARKMLK